MLERMPCAQASGPGEPSKARHTPLASRPRGLACGSQQRPFIYDSAFGWPLRASPCEPGSLPRPELHSFHVSRQLFLVSRRPGAHGLQAMERKFRSWLAPVRQRRDPLAPLESSSLLLFVEEGPLFVLLFIFKGLPTRTGQRPSKRAGTSSNERGSLQTLACCFHNVFFLSFLFSFLS